MGSNRPPHRSRRAELLHRAPASGSDIETLVGPGMTDSGWRKPALGDSVHPIPGDRALVASLLERPPPVLDTFRSESGGHLTVGRYRVVVNVASHDSTQPPALFGHRQVSLSFYLHSNFSSTVWRKDRVAKSNDFDRLGGLRIPSSAKCNATCKVQKA